MHHFEREKNEQHELQFGKGKVAQPFIEDFWTSSAEARSIENLLGAELTECMWAFDTFYRGWQYRAIVSSANGVYFPHPVRRMLSTGETELDYRVGVWSWGRLLVNLMKAGEI